MLVHRRATYKWAPAGTHLYNFNTTRLELGPLDPESNAHTLTMRPPSLLMKEKFNYNSTRFVMVFLTGSVTLATYGMLAWPHSEKKDIGKTTRLELNSFVGPLDTFF